MADYFYKVANFLDKLALLFYRAISLRFFITRLKLLHVRTGMLTYNYLNVCRDWLVTKTCLEVHNYAFVCNNA